MYGIQPTGGDCGVRVLYKIWNKNPMGNYDMPFTSWKFSKTFELRSTANHVPFSNLVNNMLKIPTLLGAMQQIKDDRESCNPNKIVAKSSFFCRLQDPEGATQLLAQMG